VSVIIYFALTDFGLHTLRPLLLAPEFNIPRLGEYLFVFLPVNLLIMPFLLLFVKADLIFFVAPPLPPAAFLFPIGAPIIIDF
jgi:hypothetical protein